MFIITYTSIIDTHVLLISCQVSGQIWSDADLKRIYAPEEIFSLPDAGNVLGFGQPFKWSSCHVSFKSNCQIPYCFFSVLIV